MESLQLALAPFQAAANEVPSLKWYAIADSAQNKALPNRLASGSHDIRCLLGGTQGSPLAQHAPHLVELCSPLNVDSAWAWVARNACVTSCFSIVATAMPFDALFDQLSECTQVVLPDGESMFFAFWDTAILGTLFGQIDDLTLHVRGPVLDLKQQSKLACGIAKWWYWDRLGDIRSLTVATLAASNSSGLLELSQWQVDDLVEASVPDHVLYYVMLNQAHLISDIPVLERYAVVRNALVRARTIGLESMRDLVDFVCVDLIYKEKMREDQAILNILKQVSLGGIAFRDALKTLP